jgi:glycopeptide antibiotics resistance protein
MVVHESTSFLVIALVVFTAWRVVLWRRLRGDPLREVAVWVFFGWVLALADLTFFPMVIIFYDWNSGINLVPFASIRQMLTEVIPAVALMNIVGNFVLLVPFGLVLALLFTTVRSTGAVAWRASVISSAIEVTQWLTGARTVDVDDVILNTSGAVVGYGIYKLLSALVGRSTDGNRFLDRLATDPSREPLTLGLVPTSVTLLLALPLLIAPVISGTLGEGENGIVGEARAQLPGSTLLARGDLEEHTFLVVGAGEEMMMVGFERIFSGRFTLVSLSDPIVGEGSAFFWTITPFNVARGETPHLVVWGRNESGAVSVEATGFGEPLGLPIQSGVFVVGSEIDPQAIMEPGLAFVADDGSDLTGEFTAS